MKRFINSCYFTSIISRDIIFIIHHSCFSAHRYLKLEFQAIIIYAYSNKIRNKVHILLHTFGCIWKVATEYDTAHDLNFESYDDGKRTKTSLVNEDHESRNNTIMLGTEGMRACG